MRIDADDGSQAPDPFDGAGEPWRKEQDGPRSLRDLQEESGDEDEVDDVFAIDRLEARDAGVELDRTDGPEAPLS